jgi:hypothetical protein
MVSKKFHDLCAQRQLANQLARIINKMQHTIYDLFLSELFVFEVLKTPSSHQIWGS